MHQAASWRVQRLALCMAATVACSSSDPEQQPTAGSGGMDAEPPTAGTIGAITGGHSAGDGTPGAGRGGVGGSGVGGAPGGAPVVDAAVADAALADPAFADCFAPMDEAESGDSKTPYPGGRWTVPKASYGTLIESDVRDRDE